MSDLRHWLMLVETRLTIYRGEYSGNRGGNFYSPDRAFARQFTQSGLDREVKVRHIDSTAIFRPPQPVYAGDPDAVEAIIVVARRAGFKAVWLAEQKGDQTPREPDSIYVFDRSALI